LNGLKLFYTDAIMPGDAELEVAIDQCFVRTKGSGVQVVRWMLRVWGRNIMPYPEAGYSFAG